MGCGPHKLRAAGHTNCGLRATQIAGRGPHKLRAAGHTNCELRATQIAGNHLRAAGIMHVSIDYWLLGSGDWFKPWSMHLFQIMIHHRLFVLISGL